MLNANDYDPFTVFQPVNSYAAGSGDRYVFHGKQKNEEINGSGVDYDYNGKAISRAIDTPISKISGVILPNIDNTNFHE